MYRFLLENREELLARERSRLEAGHRHAETVVYQEMTNGLIAAAAAEVCQYAEDLGVLVRACRSDDYFARDLKGTRAGVIQQDVKSWTNATNETAARALRIPDLPEDPGWDEKDSRVREYVLGRARARERIRAVGRFYRDWEFFFMSYKHGLMLALTETGDAVQNAEFLQSRRNSFKGNPGAFDSRPLNQVIDQDEMDYVLIPNVDPLDLRWNLSELAKERNLLRIVLPPREDGEPHMLAFERISSCISQLQRVLIWNRAYELEEKHGFHVPHEDPDAVLDFAFGEPQQVV